MIYRITRSRTIEETVDMTEAELLEGGYSPEEVEYLAGALNAWEKWGACDVANHVPSD